VITVRAVGVDDWAIWRDLRLAALADAPHAFTSTVDEWRDADEQRWRSRLAAGALHLVAWFVDYDDTDATPADFEAATDPDDFAPFITR